MLKKAFHLCLELEAPTGIALKTLGNDACQRLVAYQHLPVAGF
ncbi:hypothetical protein [Nitrosospira multiformis]|nr:hypothetical protein [Nitrosospira multiformis]